MIGIVPQVCLGHSRLLHEGIVNDNFNSEREQSTLMFICLFRITLRNAGIKNVGQEQSLARWFRL